MVDIRVPDGRIVRFPDDMPREEIRAFIQQKFPEAAQGRPVIQSGQEIGTVNSAPGQPLDISVYGSPTPSPPQQPQREGLFPQFASGMTEGAANFLSLPNTIEMGLRSIGPAIGNAMGGNFAYPESSVLPDVGQSFRNFANNTGAMTAPSEDMGGRIVRRIGNEIGANIIPMAGSATRATGIAQALAQGGTELGLTAASGLGAGVANEAFPGNPVADLVGQALGFGAGVGLIEGGRKLITPNPISPERLAVVQALQNEGVDLTAGQVTGSPQLKAMEGELGGQTAQNFMENQGEQFTNAALQRIGVNAPRATPEVLDAAYQNIGAEFDRLAANATVPVDQAIIGDLQTASANYTNLVENNAAPAVQNYIDEIFEHAANSPPGQPMLTGEQYQSLRSRIGADMRRTRSPELAEALGDIQAALDDGVERYLAMVSPDDIPAWQEVRNQYRNFLVVERAASGAGENTALGLLSPAQLRQAAVMQSRRGYVRGMGDFAELARNGVAMMTPLPNSGTATRTAAHNLFSSAPAIAGTLLGGAAGGGNPLAAIAGGVAGVAVPSQVGKALLSPLGRRYLTNQAILPGDGYGPNSMSAIVRALVAQGEYDQ